MALSPVGNKENLKPEQKISLSPDLVKSVPYYD